MDNGQRVKNLKYCWKKPYVSTESNSRISRISTGYQGLLYTGYHELLPLGSQYVELALRRRGIIILIFPSKPQQNNDLKWHLFFRGSSPVNCNVSQVKQEGFPSQKKRSWENQIYRGGIVEVVGKSFLFWTQGGRRRFYFEKKNGLF